MTDQKTPQAYVTTNYTPFEASHTSLWYLDSGATHHVTPYTTMINNLQPYHGMNQLHLGNGKGLTIFSSSNILLNNSSSSLKLRNVLHVPEITNYYLSYNSQLTDNNVCQISFCLLSCE